MLTKHRCIPARSGMRHFVSHRRHASIWFHIGRAGIRSHTGAFAGIYRAVSHYKISIAVRNINININPTCTKCQESSESECWSWTQHGRRRRFCGRIPRRLFAHSANWLYTCVMVWTMKLFAKCAWPQRKLRPDDGSHCGRGNYSVGINGLRVPHRLFLMEGKQLCRRFVLHF